MLADMESQNKPPHPRLRQHDGDPFRKRDDIAAGSWLYGFSDLPGTDPPELHRQIEPKGRNPFRKQTLTHY